MSVFAIFTFLKLIYSICCFFLGHSLIWNNNMGWNYWQFLLICILLFSHLNKLPSLLHSDDVNLRIEVGESIAMLYELAREQNEVSILGQESSLVISLTLFKLATSCGLLIYFRIKEVISTKNLQSTVFKTDVCLKQIQYWGCPTVKLD